MQLEDESNRGEEHRANHDHVINSLKLENDWIDKDRAGLEGMLNLKTQEGASLYELVNELQIAKGALTTEKEQNIELIIKLQTEVDQLMKEKQAL